MELNSRKKKWEWAPRLVVLVDTLGNVMAYSQSQISLHFPVCISTSSYSHSCQSAHVEKSLP
jgi:hypothetical protein